MRALCALALAAAPLPALAQEGGDDRVAIEASVSIQSEKLLPEQLLTNSIGPSAELSTTLTYQGWEVNLWHARDVSNLANTETDITVSAPAIALGRSLSLDATVGVYFIPGREAFVGEVGVSLPLGSDWSLRASYQGTRGGFRENLVKLELSGTVQVSDGLVLDASAAVFHSSFAGAAGTSFTLGLTHRLNDNLGLRAYATGYAGGGRSDIAFGVSMVFTN